MGRNLPSKCLCDDDGQKRVEDRVDKGGQKRTCPPKVTVFCGFQKGVDKRVDKERGKAGGWTDRTTHL